MMAAMQTSQLRGELLQNESLARHTSWRAGGPARIFYTPADLDDLAHSLDIDRVALEARLGAAGYVYSADQKQFRRSDLP